MRDVLTFLSRFYLRLALAVVFFAGWGAPQESHATVMKQFSLTDLCVEADLIAWVEVGSKSSVRAGKHNFIYTDFSIRPLEIWFSSPKAAKVAGMKELTLRQIGGRHGDSEQSVVGTVAMKEGERWLVFVRVVDGRTYLVGMGYGGWWTVEEGAVWTAHPGSLHRSRAPTSNGLKLNALKEKVQGLVREVRR